jgi:hypothetical protein
VEIVAFQEMPMARALKAAVQIDSIEYPSTLTPLSRSRDHAEQQVGPGQHVADLFRREIEPATGEDAREFSFVNRRHGYGTFLPL